VIGEVEKVGKVKKQKKGNAQYMNNLVLNIYKFM
jgi:hypothetical protein